LLADTVAERGVRQPISVRPHPEQAGRWILNYGARRLRAARLAGKAEIPAFVDKTADSFDQVIENEQRENLQPLELALFVQRQMRAGLSQAEIARRLGKSRGYLTFLGALIDAPDWVMDLYRSGRCRGATELYELRNLHDGSRKAVSDWLEGRSSVSRSDLKAFKALLSSSEHSVHTPVASPSRIEVHAASASRGVSPQTRQMSSAPKAHSCVVGKSSVVLWARLDGEEVAIDLADVPKEEGWIFVRRCSADTVEAVMADRLQLLRAEDTGRRLHSIEEKP